MIQAFFIFCLWPLAALAGPGDPAPSQADAYREAGAVHLNGADESLRDSTGKAMRALVALGDRDLVGAVSQAYKAYGAFRGAENLDVARKREILARASMASAGTSNLSEEEVHFLQSSTSYRRLDPTFLEKGEYAKVAEEFEKKTGMNRADFLSMLTNFSEKKILTGDPKLFEKVEREFDSALDTIPNAAFREEARGASSQVSKSQQQGLLAKAVSALSQAASSMLAGNSKVPPVTMPPVKDRAPAGKPSGESKEAKAEPPVAANEEKADEWTDATLSLMKDPIVNAADDKGGSKFDGAISAAIEGSEQEETIFHRVTKRYRLLTPRLKPSL